MREDRNLENAIRATMYFPAELEVRNVDWSAKIPVENNMTDTDLFPIGLVVVQMEIDMGEVDMGWGREGW